MVNETVSQHEYESQLAVMSFYSLEWIIKLNKIHKSGMS